MLINNLELQLRVLPFVHWGRVEPPLTSLVLPDPHASRVCVPTVGTDTGVSRGDQGGVTISTREIGDSDETPS